MMEGTSTDNTGAHPKSMTAAAIWKYWKLAPPRLELTSRWLQWLQSWIRYPTESSFILAAVFGQDAFETTPTVDDEGFVTTSANEYARLFLSDLRILTSSAAADDFQAYWNGSIGQIFQDELVKETFIATDPPRFTNGCLL